MPQKTLTINVERQHCDNWCWLTVAMAAANAIDTSKNWTQLDLATKVYAAKLGKAETDVRNDISVGGVLKHKTAINSAGYDKPGRLHEAMGAWGTNNFDAKTPVDAQDLIKRKLALATVKSSIDKDLPLVAGYKYAVNDPLIKPKLLAQAQKKFPTKTDTELETILSNAPEHAILVVGYEADGSGSVTEVHLMNPDPLSKAPIVEKVTSDEFFAFQGLAALTSLTTTKA